MRFPETGGRNFEIYSGQRQQSRCYEYVAKGENIFRNYSRNVETIIHFSGIDTIRGKIEPVALAGIGNRRFEPRLPCF